MPNAFTKGMEVIPNYMYWVLLVLFLSSYAKLLDYRTIYKAVFWGLITAILYFYTVNSMLRGVFFFSGFQQNGFSFLLIGFGPMAVYYTQEKYGKPYGILAAILVVLAGALSGSRSGSILTALTGFLTVYSTRLNVQKIFLVVLIGTVAFFSLQLDAVKGLIFNINTRTYDLIYRTQEVKATDHSYLIRVAQIEKGLAMFEERPLVGMGLNTYDHYRYSFEGNFEGFELISRKTDMELDELSSHNSYINLLAEGGLLLIGPFILLITSLFIYFIRNFKNIHDFQKPFFWGLLGIGIHLYFITAIVNVFVWLLLGLACSTVRYNKEI
ncbi:MAG TPA: O-antigen ligase family protein [Bacteroidia bacterium]|nr:O-antigen ligase family protein [Bacteroidia bacterium]